MSGKKVFSSIYVFRVRAENLDAFLETQREAARMYADHGALEDLTFVATDTTGKYECDDFDVALPPDPGGAETEIVVGIDTFEDHAAYERAMAAIDKDERYHRLSGIVADLLGDESAVALRGEFGRAI